MAYNAAVIVGLILLLELVVRLTVPEIRPAVTEAGLFADSVFAESPGPRPGASGESMGARFSVDQRGFWEYPAAAGTDDAWLFLGDSVTMGIGVEPDSTFAGRVAAASNADVLNPSVPGFGASDYVRVLETVLARPDIAIGRISVFWCLNDAYHSQGTLSSPGGIRTLAPAVMGFVYRHLRAYQWLKAQLFDRPKTYFEFDRSLYQGDSLYFEQAAREIGRLRDLADARDVDLDFVLIPYEFQFRGGDDLPQRRLRTLLDTLEIPFIDLYLQWAGPDGTRSGRDARELYLYGDGIHLSPLGHALAAEALAAGTTAPVESH